MLRAKLSRPAYPMEWLTGTVLRGRLSALHVLQVVENECTRPRFESAQSHSTTALTLRQRSQLLAALHGNHAAV
jgi:hypothetical protein